MGAGASVKETPMQQRKEIMKKAVAVSRMRTSNFTTFSDVVTAATIPASRGDPDADEDELADQSYPEDDTWAPSPANANLAQSVRTAQAKLVEAYHKKLDVKNLFEHISQINKSLLIIKSSLKYQMTAPDSYQMFYLYLLCAADHTIEASCRDRIMYTMVENGLLGLIRKLWADLQVEYKKECGGRKATDLWKFIKKERKTLTSSISNFRFLIGILWNGTDIRDEELNVQINKHYLPLSLDILNSQYMHPIDSADFEDEDAWVGIVMGVISTLFNILRNAPSSLVEMRQKGMLSIVAKYKQGRNSHRLKRSVIMTISSLMSEEDVETHSSLIAVTDPEIKYLIQGVEQAIKSPDGIAPFYGGRDDEGMEVMSHVAMFDGNKKLMVKHGILPLIKTGLGSTNPILRQASVDCLWALIFDDSIKTQVQKDKQFLQKLQELEKSDSDSKIVESAKGALWKLEGEQKHIEEKKMERVKSAKKRTSGKVTVMLSYNHAHAERVKKVKERFEEEGLATWVDYEKMTGDAVQSMVDGIDASDVVLICFNEKYMMSQNCRAEATYAYNTQKKIVAVRVEESIKPQGWLLMLLGSGFWYDLTKPTDYEKKLNECLTVCKNTPTAAATATPTPVKTAEKKEESVPQKSGAAVNASTPSRQSTVRSELSCATWKTADISRWLSENKLEKYIDKLSDMDGELLTELVVMRDENSDMYYELLKGDYKMTAMDVLKFNKALSKLV